MMDSRRPDAADAGAIALLILIAPVLAYGMFTKILPPLWEVLMQWL